MKVQCECLKRIANHIYKADIFCTVCGGTGYRAKKPQGFAVLSPERRAEISRKGGKAAHAMGKAHKFTSEEAKAAGHKGGTKTAMRKRLSSIPDTWTEEANTDVG